MTNAGGPLVVLHLPKAGGSTLESIARQQYPDAVVVAGNAFNRLDETIDNLRRLDTSRVRAVFGHLTMGMAPYFPADARLVTVLRDPVDRTLSHYSYLVEPPAEIRTKPDRAFGLLPADREPPPRGTSLRDCLAPGGWIPDNLQTRMLCGVLSPFDELPADALDRARAALRDRFACVGVLERFDELVALLTVELGWRTVAFRTERANPSRVRRADLDDEALRLVEGRNELDRELHREAGELLTAARDAAAAGVELELAVLRRLSELDAAELDADTRADLPSVRAKLALREIELTAAHDEIDALTRSVRKLQGRVAKLEWGLDHTIGRRIRRRLRLGRSRS